MHAVARVYAQMPVTEDIDDRLLLSEAPEDFGRFYDRHVRTVLGYFQRRTRNPELAADLTAETFAAALVARRRFTPGRVPASVWLFAIAQHKLADARRRGVAEDRLRRRLAAAAVLRDRLDTVGLAGTGRPEGREVVVDLADDTPADRRTLDGLTRPGRLAMYDWEPNLVRKGPLSREEAGRLADRAGGRRIVEHEGGWFVLKDKPALTNEDLADATQIVDPGTGEPGIALTFTPDGDTAFHDLTRDIARRGADLAAPGVPAIHNAQHFAIVVDGRVTALPYIDYEELPDGIRGGGAQINGGFTLLSARVLAAVLASGPLPVAQGAQ